MLPNFPEFIELTLDDKNEYNSLISEYPPFSDISFTTLHIWWNLNGDLSLSSLNGNLIINYNLPFDADSSGYSLIGKHSIEESIRTLFAYLKQSDKPVKLVHVPQFVAETIANKEAFNIQEESDYHEYILDSRQLASLEGHDHSRTRRKVNRFLREVEGKELRIKALDLSSVETAHMVLETISGWDKKFPRANDPRGTENDAIKRTLLHSAKLDTQNLCLFIDGVLQTVILYHLSLDKKHYIINHFRVDYTIPFIFDYMTQQIADKAVKEDVPYLNMEMDLGIEGLRRHKQGLRPVHFFKKYTVTES